MPSSRDPNKASQGYCENHSHAEGLAGRRTGSGLQQRDLEQVVQNQQLFWG